MNQSMMKRMKKKQKQKFQRIVIKRMKMTAAMRKAVTQTAAQTVMKVFTKMKRQNRGQKDIKRNRKSL